MAIENAKILNTRILLKNDTLQNWNSSSLILEKGEVAFAAVTTADNYATPTYLMKVGDGEHTFSQLKWVATQAADVYSWAKAKEIKAVGEGNAVTDVEVVANEDGSTSLVLKKDVSFALASDLDNYTTTEGLTTLLDTYVTEEALATTLAGYAAKEHTHTVSEITDFETVIAGKDYATKTEAQGYADAKDEAIAAAKKAGDDAQDRADAAYGLAETKADAATTYSKTEVDGLIAPLATTEALNGVKATAEQGVADAAQALVDAKAYTDAQIAAIPEQTDYSVTCADTDFEATSDAPAFRRHTLTQNGATICTIDIPKELVVEAGSVKAVTEEGKPYAEAKVGDKYIELIIANQEEPIYVPAKDLVDIYTAEKGASEVQVAISNTNEVSATLVNGGVTEEKLSDGVKAKLNKTWEEVGVAKGLVDALAETHATDKAALEKAITEGDAATLASAQAYADGKDAAIAEAKAAGTTAQSNLEAYQTSNDAALAGVKATAEAAAVKTEVEAALAGKVDVVTGKSLVSDTEIAKLAGVSEGANKVEASETNGSIKIDGVETVVYTHPEKHTIAEVDGLQAALDGKQAAGNYSVEGHKHTKADITDFAHTHAIADLPVDATIAEGGAGLATSGAIYDFVTDAVEAVDNRLAEVPAHDSSEGDNIYAYGVTVAQDGTTTATALRVSDFGAEGGSIPQYTDSGNLHIGYSYIDWQSEQGNPNLAANCDAVGSAILDAFNKGVQYTEDSVADLRVGYVNDDDYHGIFLYRQSYVNETGYTPDMAAFSWAELPVDETPTADSTNFVTSGGVAAADAAVLEAAKGYADGKVAEVQGVASGIDARVAAIEGDYLKAADKTELSEAIAAEKARAEGIEAGLQTQINTIMNNPDAEGAINSINEFTKYVTDHGEIAEGFRTGISENKEAIAAINNESTGILKQAKDYADGLAGNYAAAEHEHVAADITDFESAVATKVESYGYATTGSVNTAVQGAKDYADSQIADKVAELDLGNTYAAKTHTHEISEVNGLTEALAAKANDSELAAIAKTGSTDDLVQGALTLVFDCGGAGV